MLVTGGAGYIMPMAEYRPVIPPKFCYRMASLTGPGVRWSSYGHLFRYMIDYRILNPGHTAFRNFASNKLPVLSCDRIAPRVSTYLISMGIVAGSAVNYSIAILNQVVAHQVHGGCLSIRVMTSLANFFLFITPGDINLQYTIDG
jgi:hypothetical protein